MPQAYYKIVPDGTAVILVSQRAVNRGQGPKPEQGWRMAFKKKHDTANFVRTNEAEGYTFEAKEFIAGA